MELTASVEYLRLIKNCGPDFQFDPDLIFKMAGFEISDLEKSGGRIPAEQFHAAWDALEGMNTDRDLGLHLGEQIFPFTGHITESILTFYASALRRITENQIEFEGVYFNHACPADISEHHRVFRAPLFFGQAENKLVFSQKFLDLAIPLANKEVLGPLEQLARNLQEKLHVNGPWTDKVHRMLLMMGDGEKPEIFTVAKNLGLSRRNLQSRLKHEGVTFQEILTDVRKERALHYLRDKEMPISQIAFLLGYSEQSAFGRAFKQWAGCTPGEYRCRLK